MSRKYTFLNLAEDVLKETKKPMTINEIWKYAISKNMEKKVESNGLTPWKSLWTRVYTDLTENKERTKFIQLSKNPSKYGLKELSYKDEDIISEDFEKVTIKNNKIEEKKLHKLLTTFVKYDPHFKCHTKTIDESKSRNPKKGLNEWTHPDIVGVYFPFEDFEPSTLNLMDCFKQNKYKIYSFELKVDLTTSYVKQYYFQAVSNSSWANEGYLVVLHLDESNDDLLNELRRLNNAFGIGIIKLDAENIAESKILFNAKFNETLDFETINKLINIKNSDFIEFVENIKKSNDINEIVGNFDEALKDSEYEKYIEENHIV